MTQLQGGMGIHSLCGLARVSRASYYRHWVQTAPREAEGELRDRIQRICLAHRSYGYRRVRAALRKQGFPVNHKKVRRLMREDNLLAVRRRKWVATTDSRHQLAVFPNLAPWIEPDGSDQLWVADLTYIRLRSEFVYLAVVLDAWSRRVVGWALGRDLTASLPKRALLNAIHRAPPGSGIGSSLRSRRTVRQFGICCGATGTPNHRQYESLRLPLRQRPLREFHADSQNGKRSTAGASARWMSFAAISSSSSSVITTRSGCTRR